jgi:hypothetical protein
MDMTRSREVMVRWWNELEYADQAKARAWHRDGGVDVLPERLVSSLQAANLLPATYPSAPPGELPWLVDFIGEAGPQT